MDEERTQSLLQFMANQGLVPTLEEEAKRKNAIEKLNQIVLAWIKKVAWQRRLPKDQITSTCATILMYGSYGLGVHGSESDIDAVCVGPFFATMQEDFFIVLRNMLQSRPEVSELHCVKNAKVPLMRFEFNGISIDLPYAQLKVLSIPENVDILNPFLLRNIDETSWKSLSGVRANKHILQLVPNLEDLLKPDFECSSLFEPFPYAKKYARLVRIFLSASDHDELGDWVGWVKSRFSSLIVKLEEVQGLCDPNPTEYVDLHVAEPNIVFYWGLQPGRSSFTDIDSIKLDFMENIINNDQGSQGRIELSIVEASHLPKNAHFDTGSGKRLKACWRISDYNMQRRRPIYSQYLPHHFVGYVATTADTEYPSAGV
ncbi:hypothetical protein HHK36_026335 [Tetracentron sinense]|uniref:polynucleotide adenylyltransferase n=1 Tax=Tetracentron sinense TaxID=13715 RepID=A0A834YL60_TETSI|nr:hypothetical protein HHK36_026335 [Tetracentron sinense]